MKRLIIVLLLLAGLTCKAQPVKGPVIIETKIHTGMMFPFYRALPAIEIAEKRGDGRMIQLH